MKYKIEVFGSSSGDMADVKAKATDLGQFLGRYADSVIVITGGCKGLPYIVASEAHKLGVEIWGFPAETNMEQLQQNAPDDDHTIYAKLQFIAEDFKFKDNLRTSMKFRNVISTANCDCGIIISGRWGTLNEFTNLIDQQKTVGVLTETGGIADELPALVDKITKEGQGKVIFNSDPGYLVKNLLGQDLV